MPTLFAKVFYIRDSATIREKSGVNLGFINYPVLEIPVLLWSILRYNLIKELPEKVIFHYLSWQFTVCLC